MRACREWKHVFLFELNKLQFIHKHINNCNYLAVCTIVYASSSAAHCCRRHSQHTHTHTPTHRHTASHRAILVHLTWAMSISIWKRMCFYKLRTNTNNGAKRWLLCFVDDDDASLLPLQLLTLLVLALALALVMMIMMIIWKFKFLKMKLLCVRWCDGNGGSGSGVAYFTAVCTRALCSIHLKYRPYHFVSHKLYRLNAMPYYYFLLFFQMYFSFYLSPSVFLPPSLSLSQSLSLPPSLQTPSNARAAYLYFLVWQ